MEATLGFFLSQLRDEFERQNRTEAVLTIDQVLEQYTLEGGPNWQELVGLAEDLAEASEVPWNMMAMEDTIDALLEWGYSSGEELHDYLTNGGLSDAQGDVLIAWIEEVQHEHRQLKKPQPTKRYWRDPELSDPIIKNE